MSGPRPLPRRIISRLAPKVSFQASVAAFDRSEGRGGSAGSRRAQADEASQRPGRVCGPRVAPDRRLAGVVTVERAGRGPASPPPRRRLHTPAGSHPGAGSAAAHSRGTSCCGQASSLQAVRKSRWPPLFGPGAGAATPPTLFSFRARASSCLRGIRYRSSLRRGTRCRRPARAGVHTDT